MKTSKVFSGSLIVFSMVFMLSVTVFAATPLAKPGSGTSPKKTNPAVSRPPKPKTLTTPGVTTTAAFVDLAVTEIQVQEVGQGALLRITVKNLGTASADAKLYMLDVKLNGTPLQGGNQPLFNARSPIGPSQTRVTGVVPDKSGRVEVTAILLPSGAAQSDNRANNILTKMLDIPETRPDFTITDLSLTEDNRIQVTIRNNGGHPPGDATGRVDIYSNNQLLASPGVNPWPSPRQNKTVTTADRIVGACRVRAAVNPSRSTLEFDYENNALEKQFTAHVLKPDLMVVDFYISDVPGSDPFCISICNSGPGTSPRMIKAEVNNVSRRPIRSAITVNLEGPLEDGQCEIFVTDLTMNQIGAISDDIQITVDPQNEIDEKHEGNNSRTKRLRVWP